LARDAEPWRVKAVERRDYLGSAVNLASRMESHGRTRCIQITRNTYELVKDAFYCEAMGIIEVKGAGQIEVWHVLDSKKPSTGNLSANAARLS
jgi:adenylate cyclase